MENNLAYMTRCLELAQKGAGHTAPNPMVGAVLVHNDRIIGEGYHKVYGGPHAEVNCLASVPNENRELIPASTLYVSLEPCSHYGKTPPCTNLILKEQIKKVIIGCPDPFDAVDGKGISLLKNAGVEVTISALEKESRDVNKRFLCFHEKKRPYIVLKWAETADGLIGSGNEGRWIISNEFSNRLVHQWRSEEAALLIGTNTALWDNPMLTNRYWSGSQPLKIVIDRNLRLPLSLNLFQGGETLIINDKKESVENNLTYHKIEKDFPLIPQLLELLHKRNIISLLVEGGTRLLESFLEAGLWDEARVIVNEEMYGGHGIGAPVFWKPTPSSTFRLLNDQISIYKNSQ